jgi:hypothetical protein
MFTRKNIGFAFCVVLIAVIFYYGINYLNRNYAIAEEKNPCTVNYNRTLCLNFIEDKVLQSLGKEHMDIYSVDSRVGLLQALATMHCPPIKITTEKP